MAATTYSREQYTLNPDGTITLAADPNSLTNAAKQWVSDRSGETSTKLGVIGGAVAAPTILENSGKAIVAGLAGDYFTCAQYAIPALIGIVGAVSAIVIPDKPQQPIGPTHEQIKTAFSSMSRDDLVSLLSQPVLATEQLQPAASDVQQSPARLHVRGSTS
jgi:hypothetical protein